MTEPQSGADLLARIKPTLREETTEVCLSNELMAQFEALDAELAEEIEKASRSAGRLADGPSKRSKELAEQIAELEEKIAAQAFTVRFRQMSKDRWRALCDNFPPRRGDELDAFAGYDRDAVLDTAVRLCMVDPVFEDCARMKEGEPCEHKDCGSWQQFAGVIPPGEWEELKVVANSVNRGVVDAPKSPLASRILGRRATG